MHLPFVTLDDTFERVTITVNDYELFEFLDDFFDADIEYEITQVKNAPAMHFAQLVNMDQIAKVLNAIPEGETESLAFE